MHTNTETAGYGGKDGAAGPFAQRLSRTVGWSLGILAAGGLAWACSVRLGLEQQFLFGWGFVLLILCVRWVRFRDPQFQRILLILLCLILAGRYWFFRTADTLFYTGPMDVGAMTLLYLAECYAIAVFLLSAFVNVSPLRRSPVPMGLQEAELPTVDVFIPTYSEPVEMVAITATAAAHMDYPRDKLNIYILDDGATHQKRMDPDPERALEALKRYEALRKLAEFLEVHYTTRGKNDHAKAGNLNQALRRTSHGQIGSALTAPVLPAPGFGDQGGDLVLILDCDHVPTRDFLKNTVGYFQQDEKLFLVQTPHFFINPDPVERNLATFEQTPGENEMFYGEVLPGLDFWESAFFCGSAALLRRRCLQEAGGIAGQTITEDAETALSLHALGYRSAYCPRPMVCGLSPETFSDFVLQRNRWAQGMTQILLLKNPLFQKGLKAYQRLAYLNTCGFWFFGLARIVFLTAPLFYLFFGLRVYNATLPQVAAYALPYLAAAMLLSDHLFGKVRRPFFSELYEAALSLYNVPAVVSTFLRPRSPRFKVTPKEKNLERDFVSPLGWPFHVLLLLLLAAYPMALYRWVRFPLEHDVLLIALGWSTFNLFFALLCLGAVTERRQIRRKHRIRTREDLAVAPAGGSRKTRAVLLDLSEDGAGFEVQGCNPFARGDRVELFSVDSSGKEYRIPAEVVRILPGRGGTFLGCLFVVEDEWTFVDIVQFVYGDSERWNRFWLRRREAPGGFAGSAGTLMRKGIQGLARNLAGTARLSVQKTRDRGALLWEAVARKT